MPLLRVQADPEEAQEGSLKWEDTSGHGWAQRCWALLQEGCHGQVFAALLHAFCCRWAITFREGGSWLGGEWAGQTSCLHRLTLPFQVLRRHDSAPNLGGREPRHPEGRHPSRYRPAASSGVSSNPILAHQLPLLSLPASAGKPDTLGRCRCTLEDLRALVLGKTGTEVRYIPCPTLFPLHCHTGPSVLAVPRSYLRQPPGTREHV